jgi:hypothetical protein
MSPGRSNRDATCRAAGTLRNRRKHGDSRVANGNVIASPPVPARFVLVYQDQLVPLREGTIVVGRSMACHVRFNAPTVSRQHLMLEVAGEVIEAENLSTSTGTLINGRKMTEKTRVHAGDLLTLGPREVRIERADPDALSRLTSTPMPALGLLPEGDDDEITQTEMEAAPHFGSFHTCPSCRTQVPFDRFACPSCGHVWGPGQPSAVLGQITSRNVSDDVQMPAQVLAIYSSEAMTIDVTLDQIRRDGAFVPTELLDTPGSTCELTLLPDGQAPLMIHAVVTSTRVETSGKGPAGIDLKFNSMSDGTRLWIDLWCRRRARG